MEHNKNIRFHGSGSDDEILDGRAELMAEEARMGIPNLAHRRRHGQEWQRRCKLAMPKLAIYVGHHWAVSMRQPSGRSRRIAVAAHPEFPLAAGDRIPRKLRDPDVKLPI